MAEAVVYVVLQKIAANLGREALKAIGSRLGKEASDLLEADNNMRQIEIEFRVMRAFLMQVPMRSSRNLAFDAWLDEVKKVSHDAEDVIDEYAYLIGKSDTKKSSSLKKLWHRSKDAGGWQSITEQLRQIEVRLSKLTSMRDRYGIAISEGEVNYPAQNSQLQHVLDSTCLNIEDNVVGIEEETAWLVQQLIHGQKELTIVSVCGMGGLGKTTLVRQVYKKDEVKQHFNCFAWIAVSQSYNIEHLLREMLKQLQEKQKDVPHRVDTMDLASLVEKLANFLQDKRYLIVLDDMWSRDAWVLLDHALSIGKKGSRIVITTRNEDVASLADDEQHTQLKTLGKKEAWDLFCSKAFPRLEGKTCPQSVAYWAEKIVDKCEGLPLAIVAIGSLLSRKKPYENEWNSFYHQLVWQIGNNPDLNSVRNALDLIINYLPGNLKNCFLYCGLFPEDPWIGGEQLIRLWIAEGFIEERGPSITMEEVGGEYLNEIAQRSLLQVVQRDAYGRAKIFQMHDLVRDIVVSKCTSEKFSLLLDNSRITMHSREARRLSVLKSDSIIYALEGGEKIRSFILLEYRVPSSWVQTVTGNFKLLRVLSLKFAEITKLPDVVTTLFNLHYLDLSYTNIKVVPKALCKLTKLQMLDLCGTDVVELPLEIKKLSKLRYLVTCVNHDRDSRIFDCFQGAKIHSGICLLRDMQVLGHVEANKDLVANVCNFTLLRKLYIMKVKREHIKELWTSITRMAHLSNLLIISYSEEEVLNLENLDHLPNLAWFYLKGKLQGGVVPSVFSGFGKLMDLRMGWSRLQVDPIPSFAHMLHLVELHLYRVYEGQIMTFGAGWFPKLEKLYLADMEAAQLHSSGDGDHANPKLCKAHWSQKYAGGSSGIPKLNLAPRDRYATRIYDYGTTTGRPRKESPSAHDACMGPPAFLLSTHRPVSFFLDNLAV
ncbi:disease resistance protein RPM1-like [Miscanthus floridulus]|uniref:disease resistance protein RPM1-like n=1 Tax=Miscanthus floridulus TaxID=154761 RepID=UPI003458C619